MYCIIPIFHTHCSFTFFSLTVPHCSFDFTCLHFTLLSQVTFIPQPCYPWGQRWSPEHTGCNSGTTSGLAYTLCDFGRTSDPSNMLARTFYYFVRTSEHDHIIPVVPAELRTVIRCVGWIGRLVVDRIGSIFSTLFGNRGSLLKSSYVVVVAVEIYSTPYG